MDCTSQTIRDWIEKEQLEGQKVRGRWRVSGESVEAHPRFRKPTDDGTKARLDRLETQVGALQGDHSAALKQVEAISRERDEYRARAQQAQEQALLLNATVRELEQAMRSLLEGVARQSEAIAQSLVPGTPADLEN